MLLLEGCELGAGLVAFGHEFLDDGAQLSVLVEGGVALPGDLLGVTVDVNRDGLTLSGSAHISSFSLSA